MTDSKPKALELFCFEHILLYRVHQRIQKLQTQVLTTYEILTYILDTFPDIYVWNWCIYRLCSVSYLENRRRSTMHMQYCVPHSLRTACAK